MIKYCAFWGILALGLLMSCAGQKEQIVRIDTRHGEIVAILFDDTPAHKNNFLDLAESGRFDSTEFHRVLPDFMIQGGDVFTKEEMPAEEWPTLPAEILPHHFHKKGMIAAARQGNNINPQSGQVVLSFTLSWGKSTPKTSSLQTWLNCKLLLCNMSSYRVRTILDRNIHDSMSYRSLIH